MQGKFGVRKRRTSEPLKKSLKSNRGILRTNKRKTMGTEENELEGFNPHPRASDTALLKTQRNVGGMGSGEKDGGPLREMLNPKM